MKSSPLTASKKIVLKVPEAKYVNRPFPTSEHEARHSFQFNACSALLDGNMSIHSFSEDKICRPQLKQLLQKLQVEHPNDNKPNFEKLYCEMSVTLQNGDVFTERCNTFYGHWRKPLSQEDLVKKFKSNAATVLSSEAVDGIVETVEKLEEVVDCSVLSSFLRLRHEAAVGYKHQLSQ